MSIVAEFARKLHEKDSRANQRILSPVLCTGEHRRLTDIRAVVCDVYGTVCNYQRTVFSDQQKREAALLEAFKKTVDRFGLAPSLQSANSADLPEKTLCDFYHGLISIKHSLAKDKNVEYPEVKIETVWKAIILILQRHGFDVSALNLGTDLDTAMCMAFYYNFHSLGRGFYRGVIDTLRHFKEQGMVLGIVSNGQFYTPMDLTLCIRDEKAHGYDDYLELFDRDLIFYSYEYGVAKPHQLLFQKLYDALYEFSILPSQVVFIGNDLASDIQPAAAAGMRTAFFCGDSASAYMYDLEGKVVPDLAFSDWDDLKHCLSLGEK